MNPTCLLILSISSTALLAENADPELIFDRPQGTRDQASFHFHAGWESRYVSEGRDNLDGSGLITGTLEAGWEYLSFGVWYADSPSNSYNELQLSAALTQEWGDFEVYLAYTHLRQPWAGEHDHEIGLGVAWSGLPYGLVAALDSYNSIDASGTFIELSLASDFELTDSLTFTPALTFGMNQGYISDGHDGANHIAANLGLEYAFSEVFAVAAHASYSMAIDREVLRPGDGLLGDIFHTGIELIWTF